MEITETENLIRKHLCNQNLATYDPYDIWTSILGQNLKSRYYDGGMLWKLVIYVYSFFGAIFGKLLRFMGVSMKREYPIVRAQAGLVLLNMFEIKNDKYYLDYAVMHYHWLLKNAIPTKSGLAWGIGFNWVVSGKLSYSSTTPLITHSYYVIRFLVELHKRIELDGLNELIKNAVRYVDNDLVPILDEKEVLAYAYSDVKDRIAINVQSYILSAIEITHDYSEQKYEARYGKVKRLFNFIKREQHISGYWFYEANNENSFIDCFHSCFILKCLVDYNLEENKEALNNVVSTGYNYILQKFSAKKGLAPRYSVSNKLNPVTYDLYDQAELLNTHRFMGNAEEYNRLLSLVIKKFVSKHKVYTRILFQFFKADSNCLRWGLVPLLLTITEHKKNQKCAE